MSRHDAAAVKKFVLFGGTTKSKTDSDIHFVSAAQLCKLYGLKPAECVFIDNAEHRYRLRGLDMSKMTALHPRYDGDYRIPDAFA